LGCAHTCLHRLCQWNRYPSCYYSFTCILRQLGLALLRSAKSVQGKTTNYWYLMLRDNLNLYAVRPTYPPFFALTHVSPRQLGP
jgi:hypothetical protein